LANCCLTQSRRDGREVKVEFAADLRRLTLMEGFWAKGNFNRDMQDEQDKGIQLKPLSIVYG